MKTIILFSLCVSPVPNYNGLTLMKQAIRYSEGMQPGAGIKRASPSAAAALHVAPPEIFFVSSSSSTDSESMQPYADDADFEAVYDADKILAESVRPVDAERIARVCSKSRHQMWLLQRTVEYGNVITCIDCQGSR